MLRNKKMEATEVRICNLCGYLTNASSFKKHKMVHTGEKPYLCGSCEYSCTSAGALKAHSFTHTGEKPYQCDSCDYSCTKTGHLKSHSYTHTGEKPYKCVICDYSCTSTGPQPDQLAVKRDGSSNFSQNALWASLM